MNRMRFSFLVCVSLLVGACVSPGTIGKGDDDISIRDEPGDSHASSDADSNDNSDSASGPDSSGDSINPGDSESSGEADGDDDQGPDSDPIVLTPNITVDTSTRHQTIDGFGGALPMWVASASTMLTTDEVRTAVGMGDNELGLSILRTIIEPNSSSWSFAVGNLQEAKSYGEDVQILASPWSPPAHMKSNNSTTNGGKLLTQYYGDYADHLNDYVEYMAGQGVSIDVVSIQNEPDWHPNYDSCDWSGQEMKDFVRDHGAAIQGAKLLVGESLRFDRAYTDPSLNDVGAVANLDIVGGHLYDAESSGNLSKYPLAEEKGKNRWMTEWLVHDADGSGAAIWGGDNQAVWDESLDVMLRSVHMSMVVDWSAYIWWWLRRFYSFIGDGESQYGTRKGEILKRGWAFSHYSKFVRPGFVRVGTSADASVRSLELTAYDGDGKIVAVILNRGSNDYDDVVFEIPDTVTSAGAYVTSRSKNREAIDVTSQGRYATVSSIAARSVVTVVMSYEL